MREQDRGDVNPEMVTLARESRGLTQTELARQLNVTQGYLSKVESGLQGFKDELLPKLVEVLGYPQNFFLQPDRVLGPGLTGLYYRKRADVPVRTLNKVEAQFNILRMHVDRMLRHIELEDPEFPSVTPGPKLRPAEIANRLRALWRVPSGPIFSVVKLIEDAGGLVLPMDFGTPQIDAAGIHNPKGPPLFFLNKNSPADRQRFTLCHEIGHIVMHGGLPESDVEQEANEFASEFLMPAHEIRHQLIGLTIPKAAALKQTWKVSMHALVFRAKQLGAITAEQARSLFIQLAPHRKSEPIDLPPEEPTMLDEIVKVFTNELHYSLPELSELLALSEEEVRQLYFGRSSPKLWVIRRSRTQG